MDSWQNLTATAAVIYCLVLLVKEQLIRSKDDREVVKSMTAGLAGVKGSLDNLATSVDHSCKQMEELRKMGSDFKAGRVKICEYRAEHT